MLEILVAGTVIILIILSVFSYYSYSSEKKTWNNGFSPRGRIWRRFDVDSRGARGYTDGAGNYCWVSWKKIDKNCR